jgi:hypothetical protein
LSDLRVQDGELLEAFRTGGKCEYELPAIMATMEVLGRADACDAGTNADSDAAS